MFFTEVPVYVAYQARGCFQGMISRVAHDSFEERLALCDARDGQDES